MKYGSRIIEAHSLDTQRNLIRGLRDNFLRISIIRSTGSNSEFTLTFVNFFLCVSMVEGVKDDDRSPSGSHLCVCRLAQNFCLGENPKVFINAIAINIVSSFHISK